MTPQELNARHIADLERLLAQAQRLPESACNKAQLVADLKKKLAKAKAQAGK